MTDKIICMGKNYLAHAVELNDPVPEKPVIFLKPPSVLVQAKRWQDTLSLPLCYSQQHLHYECEIVLKIAQSGENISISRAYSNISHITVGLDMTFRALQASLKKNGHPWTIAKVFKNSAIIGPWIPISDFPAWMNTDFSLLINEDIKQHARPSEMLHQPNELISYASQCFPLCHEDIIFTGTPAGVGDIMPRTNVLLKWGNYSYSVRWD